MNKLMAESLGRVNKYIYKYIYIVCLLKNKKENYISKNIDKKIVIEA